MLKKTMLFFLAFIMLLLLASCGGQNAASDISVSDAGLVSGKLRTKADIASLVVKTQAKNSDGKSNFTGEMPLPASRTDDNTVTFEFSLFSALFSAGATLSYSPFDNILERFLEDKITCEIKADGKVIASFPLDTSNVDEQKVVEAYQATKAEEEE